MANVIISGDTSGAITLAAPAVAGTNTISLPASTGTLVVTSGAQTIEFADGTVSAPSITNSGDTNTGIFFPAADTIAFTEGGVESMRIDSSGNLGIGTDSPSGFRLRVLGGAASIDQVSASGATLTLNRSGNPGGVAFQFSGTETGQIQGISGGGLNFFTGSSPTQRMRITSGGDVLVAKTAANLGVLGCELRANGRIGSAMAESTSAMDTLDVYSTGAGAYRFYVQMDGKVNATNTTIAAISDQRLKENIQDIDVGLDALMALKPRKFDWKEGKGKNIKGDRGWIAQEFEQVFPDMIGIWKDPAPEGEEPYKSVAADLIPVLVKAIQEQQQIINDLKARIETLENT